MHGYGVAASGGAKVRTGHDLPFSMSLSSLNWPYIGVENWDATLMSILG